VAHLVERAGSLEYTSGGRSTSQKIWSVSIVEPWSSGTEATTPPAWKKFLDLTQIRACRVPTNNRADVVEQRVDRTELWKPCVVPRCRSIGRATPHATSRASVHGRALRLESHEDPVES
jgi:hypothetical protein